MSITLFGYNVWQRRVDPSLYNKQDIVDVINDNVNIDPERNHWNGGGKLHHSYNDIDNPKFKEPDYSSLLPVYSKLLDEYIKETKLHGLFNFHITNYTVIKGQDQYMSIHDHCLEDEIVAVHYLSYDPTCHYPLIFHNENPDFKWLKYQKIKDRILPNSCEHSQYFTTWTPEIKEDDIIFFPSNLSHSVHPSKDHVYLDTNKNRICIATNIRAVENDT